MELSWTPIGTDSAAAGFISLVQNLTNVKVIIVRNCDLNRLSPATVSSVVGAFTGCDSLKVLDMRGNLQWLSPATVSSVVGAITGCDSLQVLDMKWNEFSVATTTLIIDGLAQLQSLRYLGLRLPGGQMDLYKTFHDTINKYRHSLLFISWGS